MSNQQAPVARGAALPFADRVNSIGSEQPFRWLLAGWRDFRRSGIVSLAYGLVFVVAGLALTLGLYLAGHQYLIAPLSAGFLLVGPALTVGLYAISRDLERGDKATLRGALAAWRANPGPLLGMGLGLVLFLIVWIRLAVLIFAVSFPYQTPSLQAMLNATLFTSEGNVFLLIGTLVGAVMATIVFAIGVFSLPMLLDRRVDLLEAVTTSVVAVMMNAKVMALWAAIIVVFTAAGLATAYVGLAVTLPLIGHASWHAYRAVIRPPA